MINWDNVEMTKIVCFYNHIVFGDELPDEYKKIDIQGKPFFSSLYKADAIDPKYKKYFSMEENTVTGLKAIKMGDK